MASNMNTNVLTVIIASLLYAAILIFNKQNRIKRVFEAKGITYEEIDLSKDQEQRNLMREKAGISNLLPPAIFNGDTYCGDFQQFEDAVEDGLLKDFLKLQ